MDCDNSSMVRFWQDNCSRLVIKNLVDLSNEVWYMILLVKDCVNSHGSWNFLTFLSNFLEVISRISKIHISNNSQDILFWKHTSLGDILVERSTGVSSYTGSWVGAIYVVF